MMAQIGRATQAGVGRHLIFVYGTLKRGEPNHYISQQTDIGSCEFVSRALTVEQWPLVVSQDYFRTPFVLAKSGTGQHVYGEIYRMDDAMLKEFDRLEGHPVFYERDGVQVRRVDDRGNVTGQPEDVEMYFMKRYQPGMLEFKYFNDYSSKDHPPYVLPPDRDPEDMAERKKKYILR